MKNEVNFERFETAGSPEDLAEVLGAVRLTHLTLEAVQGVEAPLTEFRAGPGQYGHSFRMMLTLLTYAYARGVYGSNEIHEHTRTDFDFRYLATSEVPEADVLRLFRRREWSRLQKCLSKVLRSASEFGGDAPAKDSEIEAAKRLEHAVAADSLALDY